MTSTGEIVGLATELAQKREFALWAGSYDESLNPMLALEERFLASILPGARDKDVLDVGCGTGRWLRRLLATEPRTLTGIDFSPEMLEHARQKLGGRAVLAVGEATSLPAADSSCDIVLASFVASYVPDLPAFAAELRRVVRDHGRLYVSDIHPETVRTCNWKRAFHVEHTSVDLTTYTHSLERIIACFRGAGFKVACMLEPPFGAPEFDLFCRAGKEEAFYAAGAKPAIYILEFQPAGDRRAVSDPRTEGSCWSLSGARIALNAHTAITGNVEIVGRKFRSIATSQRDRGDSPSLNLDGYLLLPGLINAHDHLEFGLYPNLGHGPYDNSAQWARDIHERERATIDTYESVPRDVRLWWGAIRNLLCGVTTVCHHNPLHPELLSDDFPVRIVTNCGWGHSLAMDGQLEAKHRSTPENHPFVLHACEGLDEISANELGELERRGLLDARTILVHGLALRAGDIALLNSRGATLVWCPTSNRFLFGRTHAIGTIASLNRVLLGSDSPLTAAGDLLDEIRIAHQEIGVAPEALYRMVFDSAPAAFRLGNGEGQIRPDAAADVIAVRDAGLTPAEELAKLASTDIELVVLRGRVQLASGEMLKRLPPRLTAGLYPLEVDSAVRWIRAPLERLIAEAQKVLGSDIQIGGKRIALC
jgi:cytosine/adenosine deaminase-related metal-dependent hydrolase/SAM-dependent methyltransferase